MNVEKLIKIKNNFLSELIKADNNETSSIPYIRHSLNKKSLVSDNDIFQVMVIGGTVFRSALCKKQDGKVTIISKSKSNPPKFADKSDFLDFIYSKIHDSVEVLAINFAYPMEPIFENNHLDGKLISGSKENKFKDFVGSRVGQSITEMVSDRDKKKITVTVANDTLCLLLSGLNHFEKDQLFGGIVGTGINFSFFTSDDIAVNLESANFDKFELSDIAKKIDEISVQPGRALFEKEVAGAYLFQHLNLRYMNEQEYKLLSDTSELAKLIEAGGEYSQEAQKLFEHSASMVACQIAGILEFKKKNMVGIMEGSLFWKADNYKTLVETYLAMLTEYRVTFTKVDDDSILGGAMLVG